MTVERITVSIESSLAAQVRDAADADSQSVSAWFAEAARGHLVSRGLRDVVDEWEQANGEFTDEELARARERLDL